MEKWKPKAAPHFPTGPTTNNLNRTFHLLIKPVILIC